MMALHLIKFFFFFQIKCVMTAKSETDLVLISGNITFLMSMYKHSIWKRSLSVMIVIINSLKKNGSIIFQKIISFLQQRYRYIPFEYTWGQHEHDCECVLQISFTPSSQSYIVLSSNSQRCEFTLFNVVSTISGDHISSLVYLFYHLI